jgi:hypothetical protein
LRISGTSVPIRIPPSKRSELDLGKKKQYFPTSTTVEWVYGYCGEDAAMADNLHMLASTGELVYYVADIVVLVSGVTDCHAIT